MIKINRKKEKVCKICAFKKIVKLSTVVQLANLLLSPPRNQRLNYINYITHLYTSSLKFVYKAVTSDVPLKLSGEQISFRAFSLFLN
jgi:hypothetical protein